MIIANTALFLPDFRSLKMLLAVFFLSELLAFLLTLATIHPPHFLSDFFLHSLFILWIALPSIGILSAIRPLLQPLSHLLVGSLGFILIQLITFSISYFTLTLLPQLSIIFPSLSHAEKYTFYLRSSGISVVVSLAFLRYLYILTQWQQSIEANANAKLYALQARMRPHFLFNSLNSIASLTRINPALAETLTEDLAELLRASINLDQKLLVPLADELKLVELYLNIEKQRLDERLQIRWQLEKIPRSILLPPLSLQPLVENAVYYGIEPNPKGGEIIIAGTLTAKKLTLCISNSYQSVPHADSRHSNHIALTNLAARLKGSLEEAVLQVSQTNNLYQVTLELPWK